MKLADVSVKRPVFAIMMTAALIVLGIAALISGILSLVGLVAGLVGICQVTSWLVTRGTSQRVAA